nr:hypothetical protein Iba_chr11dCG11410 [Ipomoea batatas]
MDAQWWSSQSIHHNTWDSLFEAEQIVWELQWGSELVWEVAMVDLLQPEQTRKRQTTTRKRVTVTRRRWTATRKGLNSTLRWPTLTPERKARTVLPVTQQTSRNLVTLTGADYTVVVEKGYFYQNLTCCDRHEVER